ncbi:hypothetical protein PAMP_010091 [Pampus punctatissimus]
MLKTLSNIEYGWREKETTKFGPSGTERCKFCGKSASSELGSPLNKGLVSCLLAVSSETSSMTAELAVTSKIPHRGKAPTASRSSKRTQIQDILRTENKMRHFFNKTNIEEIIVSQYPSSTETLDNFLGDTPAVPHLSRHDTLYVKSEEEEPDDDLLASWQSMYRRSVGKTASQSNSTSQSHSSHSLQFTVKYMKSFREEEAEAIQRGTGSNETSSLRTSGQLDNLNVAMMIQDEELACKIRMSNTQPTDAQSVEEIVSGPKTKVII